MNSENVDYIVIIVKYRSCISKTTMSVGNHGKEFKVLFFALSEFERMKSYKF